MSDTAKLAADAQRTTALLVAREARAFADELRAHGNATFAQVGERFGRCAETIVDLLQTLERERRERGATR